MQAAAAITDPVRREILEMLHRHPAAAGEIAGRFAISRPAISRHLRVLRECGLVHDTVTGRRRVYTLDPLPLQEIADWITQFTVPAGWEQRFDALETEVARTRGDRRRIRRGPGHAPGDDPQPSDNEEIA
jgi:DNA-binding transcriptional ArsR family regulator